MSKTLPSRALRLPEGLGRHAGRGTLAPRLPFASSCPGVTSDCESLGCGHRGPLACAPPGSPRCRGGGTRDSRHRSAVMARSSWFSHSRSREKRREGREPGRGFPATGVSTRASVAPLDRGQGNGQGGSPPSKRRPQLSRSRKGCKRSSAAVTWSSRPSATGSPSSSAARKRASRRSRAAIA